MADVENNNELMEVTSHEGFDENGENVTDITETIDSQDGVSVSVNEEDILQQALVEASESFPGGVQIQYTADGVALQEGQIINSGDEGVAFMSTVGVGQENNDQLTETFENGNLMLATEPSNAIANGSVVEPIMTNGVVRREDGMEYVHIGEQESLTVSQDKMEDEINQEDSCVKPDEGDGEQITLHTSQNPPLGSSMNPIRIIQQGNQYTPMQNLSTDQLQQIMQVVQQQHVTKTLDTGSSVLFNPQTNTKIVYRVIHPAELHKDGDGINKGQQTFPHTTPKKIYKKRHKEDDPEKIDGPELSKEEKELRKKRRAKTRSGRVSKPPKHMVKDFKHIHVLDYDEDYDDSDGGYSDYKVESDDGGGERERNDDDIYSGLNSIKPKKWKCVSCGKAYIGRAGLARHLKLYPTHGTIDPEGDGDMEPPPEPPDRPTPTSDTTTVIVTMADDTPTTTTLPNGISNTANSIASFSDDSRDSTNSLPATPVPPRGRGSGHRGRPRGSRSGFRGRGSYHRQDPEIRRRNRLRDITRESTDEELMEIVLPRLAKVITLWEFLLMKVEKGFPAWPHADDIYLEYVKLHHHVKKLCLQYLQYVSDTDTAARESPDLLKVEDKPIADALGLKVGPYRAKEIPDSAEEIYRYRYLTTNQAVDIDYNNKSILKRTVSVVSPDQLVSPAKKPRMTTVRPQITVVNSKRQQQTGFRPGLSTTSVLVNSLQQPPGGIQTTLSKPDKIQILTPAMAAERSTSGAARSGGTKAVSLLSNSLIRQSTPLQNNVPSQKYIIVSGMNSNLNGGVDVETLPMSTASTSQERSATTVRTVLPVTAMGAAQIDPASQVMTLTDGQTLLPSSQVLIHNGAAGEAANSSPSPSVEPVPHSSSQTTFSSVTGSQPVFISLPQVTQPQLLTPCGDEGSSKPLTEAAHQHSATVLNKSELSSTSGMEEMHSNENLSNEISNKVSVESFDKSDLRSVDEQPTMVMSLQDGGADSLILSVPSNTSQSSVSYVSAPDNASVVTGGVVYSVDPSLLLGRPESGIVTTVTSVEQDGISQLMATSTQDVMGVISTMETAAMQNTEADLEQTQMAANVATEEQGEKQVLQVQTESTEEADAIETIQIPATNIYQTEDGMIIIQNADGTTVQLQGSDGQPVSMETVQALLAMDGETQFFTEQSEGSGE